MFKYIILTIYISTMIIGAISSYFIDITYDLKLQLAQTNRIINLLENHYTLPIDYPYIWPLHPDDYAKNTSAFGLRNIPSGVYTGGSRTREHIGFDLIGTWHARVVAIADGEVIDNYYPPGGRWKGHPIYGGMIRIRHEDGRISLYAHLSATYVNETDRRFVKQGQVIGRTGRTGLVDGEHLHLEIWESGVPIQVLKYLEDMK